MKRFFTLLFVFFSFSVLGQNLIPDPSAENYIQCPDQLGPVNFFLVDWIAFRGTSDYFHSCCELPQLCWNNSLGYQEPRTGEGYIGAITRSVNLTNAREYFGVELIEPLEIGEEYYVSFHVSLAFKDAGGSRYASNNIGLLFMTENYLDPNELGAIPNFSHFQIDTVLTDTTNWVRAATTFLADSAYSQLAFGNFYDDVNTMFYDPFIPSTSGISYYYFDDFCVSKDSTLCEQISAIGEHDAKSIPLLYPNPVVDKLHIESEHPMVQVEIYSIEGKLISNENLANANHYVSTINLPSGIYMAWIRTEALTFKKRFVVQ